MLLIDSKDLRIDIDIDEIDETIKFTVDFNGLFFQHEVLEIEDVYDSDGMKISNECLYNNFIYDFKEMVEAFATKSSEAEIGEELQGKRIIRLSDAGVLKRREIEFKCFREGTSDNEQDGERHNELWIDYKNDGHWFSVSVDWQDVKIPDCMSYTMPDDFIRIVRYDPYLAYEYVDEHGFKRICGYNPISA